MSARADIDREECAAGLGDRPPDPDHPSRPGSGVGRELPAGPQILGELVGQIALANGPHGPLDVVLHPHEADIDPVPPASSCTWPARQSPSFGRPTLPVLTKWMPPISRCQGLWV